MTMLGELQDTEMTRDVIFNISKVCGGSSGAVRTQKDYFFKYIPQCLNHHLITLPSELFVRRCMICKTVDRC